MRMPDLNDLIQDLQLAKQIAIEDRNPNALIMATIGQAKLLGIDKPMLTDVTPNSNNPTVIRLVAAVPPDDYSMLTDDELRQLQAITKKMDKVTAHD